MYIHWSPFSYYFFVSLDIGIMATLIYYVLLLFNRKALIRFVMILVFLSSMYFVSKVLKLQAILWIMEQLLSILPLVIIIIFQQEIKSIIMIRFGKKFFSKLIKNSTITKTQYQEILKAIEQLSNKKIGALIIIEQSSSLDFFKENSIILNAEISSQLLLSIFSLSSPLHDGAVLIKGNQILSASVFVPITEKATSPTLGSRHRAALGITEITDAIAIVISEETSFLSFCQDGKIKHNIAIKELRKLLIRILGQ